MLAVLAASPGEPVSLTELVGRIWDGDPPDTALNVLYSQAARMRALLREHPAKIRRARGGYVLDVDPGEVDLHRARRIAAVAAESDPADSLARLREATALVPGEALSGVNGSWAEGFRETLHRERTGWLAARFAGELDGGHHELVLDELAVAVQTAPFAESLTASLMLALHRCGRPAEALVVFEDLRRRLRDELGADPSAELRDLHRRILDHDPALTLPAAAAPSLLPAAISSFAGRERELSELDGLLQQADAPSLVAIVGPAGVGKTTLAATWAHRVRDRFPGGQLYLNLRGFDQDDRALSGDEALQALLELLQVPPSRMPSTVDGRAGLYRSLLSGSGILVVLDNARDYDHVRPLLPGTPLGTVVVTSRDQLAGLAMAESVLPMRLDALADDEARQLLANRLGQQRVQAEPAAVSQIIAACGGLPLALAIVAARAASCPQFPMAAFAGELSDFRSRLDALSGPDRTTDLRAVLSWSYQALRPAAARLFRLLGLHAGPQIGIDAAASLAGLPPTAVRRLMAELTGAHVLTEYAPGRYTFHDLVRAYAGELTESTDTPAERASATAALLDHYLHTGYRAALLLSPGRRSLDLSRSRPYQGSVSELRTAADANNWFERERETLIAIIDRATADGHHERCWQIAWTVVDYLERRGRWREALACNQTALDAAHRDGDLTAQATFFNNLGLNHTRLGQYSQAHACRQEALRLATASGDHTALRHTHMGLALLYNQQGRHAESLHHNEIALAVTLAAGDDTEQVGCLNGIAAQHAALGDYDRCIAYSHKALAIPVQPGNRFRASAWDTLGYAQHRLARHPQAVTSYKQAIASFREMGIRHLEARSLARLANSLDALAQHEAAQDARQQALAIFDELDHPDAIELRKKLP
ncbi:MAG TPA: BTAD domain-containing putative transcriptional regulator [Candidatus Limnocylindrales bacterium]